jgi:FAD/FMN-containing dehydrogenase
MGDLGFPNSVVRATEPDFQAQIAEVREAGLNIMMSMKGDGKPISFIEDAAVPLEDLADYTERLKGVFERHGARGTWYAHASVGCLHVRPVLNMKDPADVTRMRSIAEECFELVRRYKGSHSGEHGDGIARSEFNEPMFGARIARAFEAVKDAFDPDGLLNQAGSRPFATVRCSLRARIRPIDDFSPQPTGRIQGPERPHGAVEMYNNNDQCRKFVAGAVSSYRATP